MSNTRTSGHLSGAKYTSSHSSVISAAAPSVRALAKLDCVRKISLGLIKALPNGIPCLKIGDEGPGCLLVKIRGSRSLQEIRIYTTDKERVAECVREFFQEPR